MKSKKKTLLSAVLAIVLCMSLIAGSTFALFTSESKVNIAVHSGKVEVNAEIKGLTLYSATTENTDSVAGTIASGNHAGTYYYESVSPNFTNGGTAVLSNENGTLKLDRVTPGDKVNFNVGIANESNVNIKYRVIVNVTSGLKLFNALKVKIDGTSLTGVSRTGAWTSLAANGNISDIPVEIYLPIEAGNEYQNLSTAMIISVEAVQSNAKTVDGALTAEVAAVAEKKTEVNTATNETAAATTISDNDKLVTVSIPATTKLTAAVVESADEHDELSLAVKVKPQDTVSKIAVLSTQASASYDVSVLLVVNGEIDETKHAIENDENNEITVSMFIGAGLTGVKLYHGVEEITYDNYNSETGYITFKTTSFSEYTVVYNADYAKETFDEQGKSTGIVVYEATETAGVYTTTDENDEEVYVTVTTDETTGEATEEVSDYIIVTGNDGVEFIKYIDGDLYIYDMTNYTGTEYTVPENITGLGGSSFSGNTTIKTLTFTNQIDSAYKALQGNSSITTVNFGSMTSIPNRMFYGCTGIKNIVIPATVNRIEDFAFYGNTTIETIIAKDLEYVGYKAFDACSALKILDIGGENVEIMGWAGRQVASIETIIIRGANASVNLDYAPAGQAKGAFVFCKTQQSSNPNTMTGVNFYVANDTVAEQFNAELNIESATRIPYSCLKVAGVDGDVYFYGVDYDTDVALWDDVIANIGSDKKIVVLSDTNIPATTVIPADVMIEGKSASEKPNLIITTANGDGLKITNQNVKFKNIIVDGKNITSGGYNSLINVEEADGVEIIGCTFKNGGKSTWNSSILIETLPATATVTVTDCIISGSFRGILRESCNANIIINNCDITATYPFNIDGGNGGTVTVNGGALHGWTSYSGVVVTFNGVEFSKGNSGYDCVAAYVDTYFNNCTFDANFDIYAQTTGFNFTLTNCTKNGVQLTAENFTELFSDSNVWNECTTTVDGIQVSVD